MATPPDEPEFPEAVHKEAHPRPRRPNHLRQRLLRDLGNQGFRIAGHAEFRHQQKNPGQTFFAGVEELIDKIGHDIPSFRGSSRPT